MTRLEGKEMEDYFTVNELGDHFGVNPKTIYRSTSQQRSSIVPFEDYELKEWITTKVRWRALPKTRRGYYDLKMSSKRN